jgi:hypothetical protein
MYTNTCIYMCIDVIIKYKNRRICTEVMRYRYEGFISRGFVAHHNPSRWICDPRNISIAGYLGESNFPLCDCKR